MSYDVAKESRKITCAPWLEGKARNVNSQNGEDGLLDALFEVIGTTNQWCFEVGANDGKMNSNTAYLIDQGWNAAMIEADAALFEKLGSRYAESKNVVCVKKRILPWTFEDTLSKAGVPTDCDLGCIDIDEQDFWVWAGMQRYRPRVMVVEFGLCRPVDQVPPLLADDIEPRPVIQAGINMINYLGHAKGYLSVARTWTNVVFVQQELLN